MLKQCNSVVSLCGSRKSHSLVRSQWFVSFAELALKLFIGLHWINNASLHFIVAECLLICFLCCFCFTAHCKVIINTTHTFYMLVFRPVRPVSPRCFLLYVWWKVCIPSAWLHDCTERGLLFQQTDTVEHIQAAHGTLGNEGSKRVLSEGQRFYPELFASGEPFLRDTVW